MTPQSLEERLAYNAHDMGEMGKFVRLEYATNILREALKSQAIEILGEVTLKKKPSHGPCCTCMDCGHYHDECVCTAQKALEAKKAEILKRYE